VKRTAIFIFLLSAVAIGTAQTLQLGMSDEAVIQQFGAPLRYLLGGSTWPTKPTADEEAVLGSRCDVYSRRTASNEYEIHIVYEDDSSESRLHPTKRVSEVIFAADKPEPLTTMIDDVAEIRALCKDGCRIWYHSDIFIVPSDDRRYTGPIAFGSLRDARGERSRISSDWVVSHVGILTIREPMSASSKLKLLPGVYKP
jgi:hypothetical protein